MYSNKYGYSPSFELGSYVRFLEDSWYNYGFGKYNGISMAHKGPNFRKMVIRTPASWYKLTE